MATITIANLTDLANLPLPVTNVAAAALSSYIATGPGLYVLSGVGQALNFTLPANTQMVLGQIVTVKRGDGSRFVINVLPQNAPQQIDSAPLVAVANAFGFVSVQWDGANWWIVARG